MKLIEKTLIAISKHLLQANKPSYRSNHGFMYGSVQRRHFGDNLAIADDEVFKYYNLYLVEIKFILAEFENPDPSVDEVTTDCVMASFGTTAFDLKKETGSL